jgi:hypothetical protein
LILLLSRWNISSLQTYEAQKSFLREHRAKICRSYKKVVPKGALHNFCRSYQKVVPKGAQRKFSAQKSFQRECRAKYRRNIYEEVPKSFLRGCKTYTAKIEGEEVQKTFLRGSRTYTEKINGEHRKINGEESSKVVPKGMQSLCVPVWVCGCVSSASSSFCIISAHHFA